MATKAQIQKIHIAKKQLKLSDENYKYLLNGFGVESSKDLTIVEADRLLARLKDLGFIPHKSPSKRRSDRPSSGGLYGKMKYEDLGNRPKHFASPKALRMIEALWRDVSKSKTDESLRVFIKNLVGVEHITFLHRYQANAVITALQKMGKK